MKVSIVINNYNYGIYLNQAIDSALAQTHCDTEVIVVDDGSTDNSREIIASYGAKVTPILKENGGQASAFNTGFAKAAGELIHFLDADDILLPEAAATAVLLYEESSYGVLQAPLRVIDAQGELTGKVYPTSELKGDPQTQICSKGDYVFPPTSGNFFSASVLRRLFPIPAGEFRICADTYVCIMTPFISSRRITESPFALYRIHGENNYVLDGKLDGSSKRLRNIRTVENAFKRFSLIEGAARSFNVKADRFYFCGNIGVIYTWIYCCRVYRLYINDRRINKIQMFTYFVVAMFKDVSMGLVQRGKLFLQAVTLIFLPQIVIRKWLFRT